MVAEGCRGSLAKVLIRHFGLAAGRSPQTYGLGIKELWQLPEGRVEPGLIQHTVGWPADQRTYAGSFLYHLDQNRVYVGYVAGLDYEDPRFRPFEAFQQFKQHPSQRTLFEGGELLSYGARTIIEGGWQSLPRLDMPGAVLIGDAGGLVNVPKIKGVHQAIRSGALAADHLLERNTSEGFEQRWRGSEGGRELYKVRNMRPGFRGGLWVGLANAALETVTAGHTPWTLKNHADHSALQRLEAAPPAGSRLGRPRHPAARSAERRLLRGQRPRRGSARAPQGGRHEHLCDALRGRIRQSLPVLLPRQRL